MKLNKIAIAVGAAVMGLSGIAQAELSGNIGATSNYLWRGVSQTGDDAAISGGVDYANESGFYAGTWISTLGNGSGEELDLYAGFSGESGSIGYDVGVIYYAYPSDQSTGGLDFTEVYAGVSFGPVSGGVAYTVDKESGVDENDLYYHLSAGTDLGDGWSLGATVGYYDMEASDMDYAHGQIDVSKSMGDLGDFTLSVSNVFDDDAILPVDQRDNDLMPFISWSKSF